MLKKNAMRAVTVYPLYKRILYIWLSINYVGASLGFDSPPNESAINEMSQENSTGRTR